MKEKIMHAACKTIGGMIFFGKCHADCFYQMKNVGKKISNSSQHQGFYTNLGRYVNRETAAIIAKKAKQLDPNSKRKVTHLLSEDIWHQCERFIYCSIRGYVEIKK